MIFFISFQDITSNILKGSKAIFIEMGGVGISIVYKGRADLGMQGPTQQS